MVAVSEFLAKAYSVYAGWEQLAIGPYNPATLRADVSEPSFETVPLSPESASAMREA